MKRPGRLARWRQRLAWVPPPSPFGRMVVLVLGRDGLYDLSIINLRRPYEDGFMVDCQRYALNEDLAFKFRDWYPGSKGFWGTYRNIIWPRALKAGFVVYRQPSDLSMLHIPPVSRLADQQTYELLTPWSARAITDSKLKAKYLASTKYGTALDSRVVVLVLIGLVALVALVLLSGRLG